jgi:chromosome segregation ATPase
MDTTAIALEQERNAIQNRSREMEAQLSALEREHTEVKAMHDLKHGAQEKLAMRTADIDQQSESVRLQLNEMKRQAQELENSRVSLMRSEATVAEREKAVDTAATHLQASELEIEETRLELSELYAQIQHVAVELSQQGNTGAVAAAPHLTAIEESLQLEAAKSRMAAKERALSSREEALAAREAALQQG